MRRWKNRDRDLRESEGSGQYSPLGYTQQYQVQERDNDPILNALDIRQIVGVGAIFTTFGAILILASIFFSRDSFDDILVSGSMIFGLALLILNITCVIMYFCFIHPGDGKGHRPQNMVINYNPLES